MNKASGGDEIPVDLFQILKDDAIKVLYSVCQQIWETQQWPHNWKRSIFITIPKKAMPKIVQTTGQLHSFLMISRLCSKSFKLDFNSTWTMNFQMFKLDLEKAEKPEIKFPITVGSWKKWEFQKNIYFCFIDYAKAFDCVDHNKLWKILKEMGIPDLPPEKSVCRSRSNS